MNSILLEYQRSKDIMYKTLDKPAIKSHATNYKKSLDNLDLDQKIDAFFKLEEDKEQFLKQVKFSFINIFDISATVNVDTLNKIVKKYSRFEKKNICIIYVLNFYSNLHKNVNRQISREINTLIPARFSLNFWSKKEIERDKKILEVYTPENFGLLLRDISELLKEESIKKNRELISKIILDILNKHIFNGRELKYGNLWFLPYFSSLDNVIAAIKNISFASKVSISELMGQINLNTGLDEIISILNMFLTKYEGQIKIMEDLKNKKAKALKGGDGVRADDRDEDEDEDLIEDEELDDLEENDDDESEDQNLEEIDDNDENMEDEIDSDLDD